MTPDEKRDEFRNRVYHLEAIILGALSGEDTSTLLSEYCNKYTPLEISERDGDNETPKGSL